LEQIRHEKYQRKQELRVIEMRKQKLEWKAKLDEKTKQLDSREARILEVDSFLTVAKKLQEMKLTLEDTLPWLETINEVAQIQNTDIKTAGICVATELRCVRQLGGIETNRGSSRGIKDVGHIH
jgi:hypothetical protein